MAANCAIETRLCTKNDLCRSVTVLTCLACLGCGELERRDDGFTGAAGDDASGDAVPCEVDADCTDQQGEFGELLAVCDAGECVECTVSQDAACRLEGADLFCHSQERSCVIAFPGTLPACFECAADAQCMPGLLCMHTKNMGVDGQLFCLPKEADLPGASCAAADPFTVREASWTSVDGVSEVVCRHPSVTCTEYWSPIWG